MSNKEILNDLCWKLWERVCPDWKGEGMIYLTILPSEFRLRVLIESKDVKKLMIRSLKRAIKKAGARIK